MRSVRKAINTAAHEGLSWLNSTNLPYLLWPGFLLLLSEAGTAWGAAQVLQDWLQGHCVDFLGLQFPSWGSC